MKIDFFELLDGIFRGVVLFLYNLVDTVVALVMRPIREPARRYAMHRRTGVKQIGPWTLLVLAYAGIILLWPAWFEESDLEAARKGLPSLLLGDGGLSVFVRILVSASLASIALDASLRLLAIVRLGRRCRRAREFRIATIEYAASLPLLAIVAGLLGFDYLEQAVGTAAALLLLLLAILFAAAPPAWLSQRLLWGRSLGKRFRRARSAGIYLLVVMLVLGSALAGVASGGLLKAHQEADSAVEILRLRCSISERGANRFAMTIWNRTGAPVFPQDLYSMAQIRDVGLDTTPDRISDFDVTFDPAPVLDIGVEPGKVAALGGTLRPRQLRPARPSDRCYIGKPWSGLVDVAGEVHAH